MKNQTIRTATLIVVLGILLSFGAIAARAADAERPNIIIIMADDMGFSDIGCYGGEIRTPTLDRLAEGGLRWTQFYNTGRCCPTRASLLTGLGPHQAGIGHMTRERGPRGDHPRGPYQGWLNRRCVTIAEVLKPAGYGTYMAGKWHVGTLDKDTWPVARGFDRYYGLINGASNFFRPADNKHLTLDETCVQPEGDDFYTTDYFTNYAIEFVDDHLTDQGAKPFFLYLAYTCPHWPLQAWPEDIARYRGTYRDGWDALRKIRLAKQKAIGLLSEDTQLSPRDTRVPLWSSLDEKKRDELEHLMAIYAAMIDRMDQNIGRLVATLEKHDALDNTLILFLADNGACAEGGPLGNYRPEMLGSRAGYGPPMYGACWANASNTPFRLYKHWVHEGGMSSPLIAHWPDRIKAERRGKFVRHYAYLPDLMATCVELAGAKYPTEYEGNEIHPMEGRSIVPLLSGVDQSIHPTPICWEHEGNRAVRDGKWKLVKRGGGPWELYDIDADRSELNNLSEIETARTAAMIEVWTKWAVRCGVRH